MKTVLIAVSFLYAAMARDLCPTDPKCGKFPLGVLSVDLDCVEQSYFPEIKACLCDKENRTEIETCKLDKAVLCFHKVEKLYRETDCFNVQRQCQDGTIPCLILIDAITKPCYINQLIRLLDCVCNLPLTEHCLGPQIKHCFEEAYYVKP